MKERVFNFNPGPSALPLEVLKEAREELLNYRSTGMSVLEISHRSKEFDEIMAQAVARVKSLMGLTDDYHVVFMTGGASSQFFYAPMNLIREGETADYINTGTWSTKAIAEARILGKSVNVAASSEDENFTYIPKEFNFSPNPAYVHITSNNTIKGTQYHSFPDTRGAPIAADMSSDILSRVFDPAPFGLIYAGAQKNIGPAGVTLVIIRDDLAKRSPETLPTMLRYSTYVAKNSLFNTPPAFAIYFANLVFKWIESAGGVAAVEKVNNEKARLLYQAIDQSGFYRGTAREDSRSKMNVTFRLPTEELEAKFIEDAAGEGMGGLKGHRSVGGLRASLYNAVGPDAVRALVSFMGEFERRHG